MSRDRPRHGPPPPSHSRRRGLVLVGTLLLMLGALILGVSVARTAFASLASARLERDRVVARAAAEAALADAQADIGGGAQPSSARAVLFATASGFAEGCGRGSHDLGLCLPAAAPQSALWQSLGLADEAGVPLVPYGRYTGAVLATGSGILPARLPGYLIEALAPAGAGPPAHRFYRVTAIGFGTRATTQVVLQTVVRKAAGTPAAGAPAVRISWREIANWPELHARAVH
jgi:type IV pilus assembly protein PilX